jgi:hypothetical protein
MPLSHGDGDVPPLPPSFSMPSPESLRSQFHSPRPAGSDANVVEIYATDEDRLRSHNISPR